MDRPLENTEIAEGRGARREEFSTATSQAGLRDGFSACSASEKPRHWAIRYPERNCRTESNAQSQLLRAPVIAAEDCGVCDALSEPP